MEQSEVSRALVVAKSVASGLGLKADYAEVLHNSNNLAVRLGPCDAFARIAPSDRNAAALEVALAQALVGAGCPVGALDPRVAPRPYEQDGFTITLWTYYAPLAGALAPDAYAKALQQLHAGLRGVDLAPQHFTDRVAWAEKVVAEPPRTPALADADRAFLGGKLASFRRAIAERGAPEQLLHGEPHPGNLINAKDGPVFIDLETCCRGPVEFDIAHAPRAVAAHYPGVDPDLLSDCHGLILAMVAAWRWEGDDEFPNGRRIGEALLAVLRRGPPWPTLDELMSDLASA